MSVKLFFRSFKHFIQRWTRGFSDDVTWSLDVELAAWLHPRLVRFKEISIAHPYEYTEEEWDEILDKIIYALYCIRYQFDIEEYDVCVDWEKVTEGTKLLGENLTRLTW